jgi:hypothetical protein
MESAHRPWLRLYRRGSAAFQQLEPHHRGTLLEILRYTDAQGRIDLSGRSAEEALLLLLGNTRSFRPVLRTALAEGIRIGMCVVEDGHLVFPSWDAYQPDSRRAEQKQSKSRAAAEQLQSNDRAFAPNLAESFNTQNDSREEKRREEERDPEQAPLSAGAGPRLLPFEQTPPKADVVAAVFDHWRAVMGHGRAQLDGKRRRRINAALKAGYSAGDLIAAIDGCKASAFHMGANDRSTKYDGIDVIFRDADQIDKFIANAPRNVTAAKAATVARTEPSDDAVEAMRARLRAQKMGATG